MAKESYHTVKQGECLYTISRSYGFMKWESIYDHENNAELREKRPDPNCLYPGDRVYIPERISKPFQATGPFHTITVPRKALSFKIRVLDEEGRPLKNAPYKLTVGDTVYENHADGEGMIIQPMENPGKEGILEVYAKDGDETPAHIWYVSLGGLDPVDEVAGVQGRLKNLGYYAGEITGIIDEATRFALKRFQEKNAIEATGELCEQTREKLKEQG